MGHYRLVDWVEKTEDCLGLGLRLVVDCVSGRRFVNKYKQAPFEGSTMATTSKGAGSVYYGLDENAEIDLGPMAFYTIAQTEGVVYPTPPPLEATGAVVRLSKVLEDPGVEMKGLIIEPDGLCNKWVSLKALECQSGNCGHCSRCDTSFLPSENAEHYQEFKLSLQRVLTHLEEVSAELDEVNLANRELETML